MILELTKMAAAQVAKKLKDQRQKRTLEQIFHKVNGKITREKKCSPFIKDHKNRKSDKNKLC